MKGELYMPGYGVWSFLDGGVMKIFPYGMGSRRGTRTFRYRTLRYLCHEFRIEAPHRRLRAEIPSPPGLAI